MTKNQLDNIRILAVDDEEMILNLYKEILCPQYSNDFNNLASLEKNLFGESRTDHRNLNFDVTLCKQGEEALDTVKKSLHDERPFSVVFMDIRMPPGRDGIWTAEQIRAVDPDINIILVTGYTDIDPVEITPRIPPMDKLLYIQKPFHPQELRQFAIAMSAKWSLEKELKKIQKDLENMVEDRTNELVMANENLKQEIMKRSQVEKEFTYDAFHDKLTGLSNREVFMDRLGSSIERKRRIPNYMFAVLIMDLDHFKVINDSLGHAIGDQLLVAVAQKLQFFLRSGDTIARLGGDEFVITLDNIKQEQDATKIADRIQKELQQPLKVNDHEVFSTVTIGIALSAENYTTPEEILRDADTALHRAKSLGRARYEMFNRTMHDKAVARMRIENDLRRAVEKEEFLVFYQPIVNLFTGDYNGFEALVRWKHPERGFISPVEFIYIAEETGLIVSIDQLVLRKACNQINIWKQQFPNKGLFVNVNLSTKQFSQPDLVEQITKIIKETKIDSKSLKLEITESVIMENLESAANKLSQLRALDIKLYMDDFGTGYSSLSYLHRFPIDALKIDRSFVKRIGLDNESTEIIKTIMTLAKSLKLHVVVEGIETKEQLDHLKNLDCKEGQGFLFSKPIPDEEISILLTSGSNWSKIINS
jgi:diguanylate cyclase (GGDEF)-like protein